MNKYLSASALAFIFAVTLNAKEFYGKIDLGAATLLKPDIADTGFNKGGFCAQALFGEENLRPGAEFGYLEAYTSWDKDRLNINKSLIFVRLNGVLQCDLPQGYLTPYLSLSAGPYFGIENFSSSGGSNSSSGSKTYFGGNIACGVRLPFSKGYDLDFCLRYFRVNASEDIEMLGAYVGFGTKFSFFPKKKTDNISLPLSEKGTPPAPL
jgi:hypothetical protein